MRGSSNTEGTDPGPCPALYVPRNGKLERIEAGDVDHLRAYRTELELLLRIARKLRLFGWRAVHDSKVAGESPRRAELGRILRDAAHPVVEAMVLIVDKEFPEIRKDIVMAIVNEEAENILQQAAECDAVEPRPPADPEMPSAPDATLPNAKAEDLPTTLVDMESAIDAAQSALQQAAAEPDSVPLDSGEAVGELPQSPATEETAGVPRTVEATAPTRRPAGGVAESAERVTEGSADVGGASDGVGNRAVRAAAEIERGIRHLASLSGSEMSDQRANAGKTVHEITNAPSQLRHAAAEAKRAIRRLRRLGEEMEVARDDANNARREALLFRQDALRAKERAEAAADVAESAADYATRQVEHATPAPAPGTTTLP